MIRLKHVSTTTANFGPLLGVLGFHAVLAAVSILYGSLELNDFVAESRRANSSRIGMSGDKLQGIDGIDDCGLEVHLGTTAVLLRFDG